MAYPNQNYVNMGVSQARPGGSRVPHGGTRSSAYAGVLALVFLVGITGTHAQNPSFPSDTEFCSGWVGYGICKGAGAQDFSSMCDSSGVSSICMFDAGPPSRCDISNTPALMAWDTAKGGSSAGWLEELDMLCGGNIDSSTGNSVCDASDGCMEVHNGISYECKPFPSKSKETLVAWNAPDAIIAFDQALRHEYYCPSVSISQDSDRDFCASLPGCEVYDSSGNDICQFVSEYGAYDIVTTCGSAGFSFDAADKNAIAVATFKDSWVSLEMFVNGKLPNYASSGSSVRWPTGEEYCAAWEVDTVCKQGYPTPDNATSCDADAKCAFQVGANECLGSNTTGAGAVLSYEDAWSYNEILHNTGLADEYKLAELLLNCSTYNSGTDTACDADPSCATNWKKKLFAGMMSCEISHEIIARNAIDEDGAPFPYAKRAELDAYHDQVCFFMHDETACNADSLCAWDSIWVPGGCGPSPDSYTVTAMNACVYYDQTGNFWESTKTLSAFADLLAGGFDGSFERSNVERIKYPGDVGCQLQCENWGYDQAACDAKPYYCQWNSDVSRCVSAVGEEACPEGKPTERWLPFSYFAYRFNDAFRESENKIIRVDWRGLDFAYVRVLSDAQTFDIRQRLFIDWSNVYHLLNVDFEIYSTYEDALARLKSKRWEYCGTGSNPDGFPGACAPSSDVDAYYAVKKLSDAATEHAVYLESPSPLPFGDRFSPPLDSNQAVFNENNEIASVGDLDLGGATEFTIRFRSDITDSASSTSYNWVGIVTMPGVLKLTATLVGNAALVWHLEIDGGCELNYTSTDVISGPEETVVTYNGSHVQMYQNGVLGSGYHYGAGWNTGAAPCALPVLPSASWKMSDVANAPIYGTVNYLTTWTGVALSSANVRAMFLADFRYVPKPTHHFNFDEGSGSVVRDSVPGVGGEPTARAHFGPVPVYRNAPTAPSSTTFLSTTDGTGYVSVDDSPSFSKVYQGSFTMQVWFRVEAQPSQPTNVFGNLVPGSSSGNFANLYYSDGATGKFGLMLTYEDGSNRGNVSIDGNSADALDIDRWYHLAVQRDVENGVIRIFVDGVARASSSDVDYPGKNAFYGTDLDFGLGLAIGPDSGSPCSFSDFQVYSAAVPPAFPTGPGVCAPPNPEFLVLWLPLDRVGDQVDASGRGAVAATKGDVTATTATQPVIDAHARTRPPLTPSTAPCGPWDVYDGCDAPEPEECSACLSSAGFDTGECGLKASGGVVRFVDGFTVHTFTKNDTFTVLRGDLDTLEVLVVGGGGGGGALQEGDQGNPGASGGGGGNVTLMTVDVARGATFQITVGVGGTGASPGLQDGTDGSQSVFEAIDNATALVTAAGGAGGASDVEADLAKGGPGSANAGALGFARGDSVSAPDEPGYGNWRDFAGEAVVAPTSGLPAAYGGGGGACIRGVVTDSLNSPGCSQGSATGGDAKPVCSFTKCDAHRNSGGGGGASLSGKSGNGADGVVIVRYQ